MTRKHFQAMADTIRLMDVDAKARKTVAQDFAGLCASFNSRFDRARFIDAATTGDPS